MAKQDSPVICAQCGAECKANASGCGTGYAVTPEDQKICYSCCAVNDRQYMLDNGKISLYLVERGNRWAVVNWPSSLEFAVFGVKKSWHNFAGKDGRRDCWFNGPDGHVWHFVSIGEMDLGRAKRTKERWSK